MPNGKKRKAPATLTPSRRVMPQKGVKHTRMAMSRETPQGQYPVRLDLPATPKIQVPANGYVPPGFDLLVLVLTNRPDLRYKLRLKDLTPPLAPDFVYDIPVPASKIFAAVFPGGSLVPEHDYELRVWVDPLDGATPPHSDDVVYITTKAAFATPVSLPPV